MKPRVLTAVLLGSTMASVGGSAYLAGVTPPSLSHLAVPGLLTASPTWFDVPAPVTFRPSRRLRSGDPGKPRSTAPLVTSPPNTSPPSTSLPTAVSSRHPVPSPPSTRAGSGALPGHGGERTRGAHSQRPPTVAATTVPVLVIVATVTYTVQKGDTWAKIGQWFASNDEGRQFRGSEPSIRNQLRRLVPGTLISISDGKASVQLPWPGAVLKPVHPMPPPDQAVEHAP
jgi:hypothetical protein